jgi:hypothetical protein
MAGMLSFAAEAIAQLWSGLSSPIELVLDHEVVELVQSILSLIGLLAQVLEQTLQARVPSQVPPLGRLQQPFSVQHLLSDLHKVEAELGAGHVRLVIRQLVEDLAEEPIRRSESHLHLLLRHRQRWIRLAAEEIWPCSVANFLQNDHVARFVII